MRRKNASCGEAVLSFGGVYGGLIVTLLVGTVTYNLLRDSGNFILVGGATLMTLVCARMTCFEYREFRRKLEEIRVVPYVPPVNLSTLPAEEVLVRGAEQPTAPNGTLLRATVKCEGAKAEELLHVVSGSSGGQDQ